MKNKLPELTKRELELMKILWKKKKASLRETHNALPVEIDISYHTTKTLLDRMVKKGYVSRERVHGLLVYSPALSKPSGVAKLVRNFMENVLEIDKSVAATLFADSKLLTPEELEELQRHLASTLSGGEARMVAIGRGLMSSAKFVAADEPSTGLAPNLRDEVFQKIKEINREKGISILMVEQRVVEVSPLADRIYVMDDGGILFEGNSEEVLSNGQVKKTFLGI